MGKKMILDASTFKLVLTPEAAMGVVQKELHHRGWKKFEVEEIRLVYTPFYAFSFDVRSEGAPPISGKAALNANTGDLSDFIPMILERPLQKTKSTEEGGEVEETAITPSEAKEAAKDKVAAQTGLKREMVSVSAFSKVYVPFFRIWLEVAHSSMKIEVDGILGAPLGLEAAPEREKTWGEAAGETIGKLKSPSGWVELTGKAIGTITGGGGHGAGHGESHGSGHGDEHAGIGPGKSRTWIILIAAIGLLLYLTMSPSSSGIKCDGKITRDNTMCSLDGTCSVSVKKTDEILGKGVIVYAKGTDGKRIPATESPLSFERETLDFKITWKPGGIECSRYDWGYDVLK